MLKPQTLITVVDKVKENSPETNVYLNALRNYFFKTRSFIPSSVSEQIQKDMNTILEHDEKNKPPEKRDLIIKATMNIIAQFIGTLVYSFIILYFVKETFDLPVSDGIKSAILLALLIMGSKVRFRLM